MKNRFPSVFVSVLIYNEVEGAIRTIECLRKQTYPNFTLHLFDNASSTKCREAIRKRFPEIPMECFSENRGYAGGNNVVLQKGFREAYEYVLLCNHDVLLDPSFLSFMVEAAQRAPQCGVMGAVEMDIVTHQVRAFGSSRFSFLSSRAKWFTAKRSFQFDQTTVETEAVQGAVLLIPRETISRGIFFDEKFFLYGDEIDFGFQLKKHGLKAYVSLKNHVYHEAHADLNPLQGYYLQRNRLYLSRKYAPKWLYPLSVCFMALIELPFKMLLRTLQGHSLFARACFSGFVDSVMGRMGRAKGF